MGTIIPARGAMYHGFRVNDLPQSSSMARLYLERFGPLAELEREAGAGPPTPPPMTSAKALNNLRKLSGVTAGAALCVTCWRDGYRLHGSNDSDRTHTFEPFGDDQ